MFTFLTVASKQVLHVSVSAACSHMHTSIFRVCI